MKRLFTFCLSILISIIANAQIQVDESNIISVGENVIRVTDTLPTSTTFTNTGAGLFWDYTGANQHTSASIDAVNPSGTPYASDFPSSNLCLTPNSSTFLYFETSANENLNVGLAGDPFNAGFNISAQLNPSSLVYDYPLQYQKSFNGAYKINEKADGSAFGVDSVWLKRESTHENTVEAYGLVETNDGIFKTIKDKRVEYSIDTILAKFSIFPGVPAQWQQVDLIYDTVVNYYFHTRESKLPVVEVATDLQANIDSTTITVTQATPEPLANFGFEDACVGEQVAFTDSSIQNPTSWFWDFGDGNTSTQQTPTHTYTSANNYTVTLVVNRNYPDTIQKTITINQVTADAGVDQSICPGSSVTLTASGGSSYAWSNNQNSASITVSPTSNTTYSVTVTDNNGCSDVDNVQVTLLPEPTKPLFDAIICNNNPVTLDAENPNSTYNWSTGAQSQTITVSNSGTYIVTVTNTSNCSVVDTAVVSTGSNLNVPLTDVDACEGDTVILNAGNTGATYNWNTGETSRTIEVTSGGTYAVTVDDQGCSGTGSATVTFNANPEPEILGDSVICAGESTYLFVNSNLNPTWSTFSSNDSISVNPTSDKYYSVELEDNLGCTGTDSVLVTVNPLPNVSITGDTEICTGEQTTLTATGGVSFLWDNNSTNQDTTVSPLNSTNYSVTVTDTNGCSDDAQTTVQVNPLPNPTISGADSICPGENITLTATGGASYLWSNGAANDSINVNPVLETIYSVTVTDANSCSNATEDTVFMKPVPAVTFAYGDTAICLDNLDTLELQAAPSGGSFSGIGVNGNALALGAILDSGLTAATVYYTYTNSDGCSGTDSIEVSLSPCPGISGIDNAIDFELYPNPVSNGFYISSPDFAENNVLISVLDLNGKMHLTQRANSTNIYISTSQLSTGMYFVIGRDRSGEILFEDKVQVLR